jgi:hypothetical protein
MPSAVVGALRVDLGVNSAQFTTGMQKATGAVQTFGRQAQSTGSAIGGFKSQMGNVGFQVADLAVQISGGTSALRAFGQQVPQVLGAFGPGGAIAGAFAAVGFAIASAFLTGKKEVEPFKEAMKSAEGAVAALADVIDLRKKSIADLGEEFRGSTTEILGMIDALAQVAQGKAAGAVEGLVNQFERFADASFFQTAADGLGEISTGAALVYEELGFALPAAQELSTAIADLGAAEGFDAQLAALVRIREVLDANRDGVDANDGAVRALYEQITNVERQVRAVAAGTDEVTAGTNRATAAASALSGAWGSVVAKSQMAAQWAAQAAAAGRGGAAPGTFGMPGATGPSYNPNDYPVFSAPDPDDFPTFGYKTPTTKAGGGGKSGGLPKISAEAKAAQQNLKDLVREAEQLHKVELREIDRAAEQMGDTFSDAFLGAIDGSKTLQESLADLAGDLASMFVSAGFSGLAKGTGFAALLQGIMPAYAGGTQFARGGLSLVGERGPELVSLPRGSKVTPNAALGGNVFTFAPVIDARGADSAAVARAMTAQAAQFEDFKRSMPDRVAHIRRDPRYKG